MGARYSGAWSRAIAVMAEAGVDISRQESMVVEAGMLQRADVVVTVCGHADEMCPALPIGVRRIHWPLADPAKATGSEDEIMAAFRATRDDVEQRVCELLAGQDPVGNLQAPDPEMRA